MKTLVSGVPPELAEPSKVQPPAPLAPLGVARPPESYEGFPRATALPPTADKITVARGSDQALGSAAYGGLLQASNAAADREAPSLRRTNGKKEPRRDAEGGSRGLVELLWLDETGLPLVRAYEEWASFMVGSSGPPPADDPAAARAQAADDRASMLAAITRAEVVHDAEAQVQRAGDDDGAFHAPLVVIAGELETTFDEVETLKIMMAAASPLAPTDKKLKELVDLAEEVMKTPLGASREVAHGFIGRVREAWSKANRLLPADYLDHHTRRLLLDQRLYQKRQLADAEWIRALVTPPNASTAIPVYMPASMGRKLPLFTRFSVRIVGELLPQQDETEASSIAVRTIALARTIGSRRR